MLIPKMRLHKEEVSDENVCSMRYYVYDTDDCAYVVNRFFTHYETREECQKQIDFYNSFKVVKVS